MADQKQEPRGSEGQGSRPTQSGQGQGGNRKNDQGGSQQSSHGGDQSRESQKSDRNR